MKISSEAEEILEFLWTTIVEQHKASCDVAVLKDNAALRELTEAGHVEVDRAHARLTANGMEEARACIRRHRLAERLMVDVLDLKKPLVHETSCEFEHLLHKGVDESICTLLGHPRTCPHGKPIPEGRCCKTVRAEARRVIVPLTELEPRQAATIAYLRTDNREALQKLIAIGALPKTELRLLQRSPALVLQLGRSQFAIDQELASHVYVRRT